MPPQLPEHVVVTLLQRCYITPKCQTSFMSRQPLSNSFTRALHAIRPCPRPQPRPRDRETARAGTRAGYSPIHTRAADGLQSSSQTQFSGLSPTDLEDCQSTVACTSRRPARGKQAEAVRIAILGGGITGLASAHYFARENPNAKITVYESSGRLGGWLKSDYVNVDGESVLFESGPRTLRPNTPSALVTKELIEELGLQDELLIASTTSDAHNNRFIYYPDRLVKMPGPGQDPFDMAWRVLTEPVFKGLIKGVVMEKYQSARPPTVDDESVGSFIARRLSGDSMANNVVSAVLHGIYAGDINKLSVKSLMPQLWNYEKWKGSIMDAMISKMKYGIDLVSKKDLDLKMEVLPKISKELTDTLRYASVYSFKNGTGALSRALERALRKNPNVEVKIQTTVNVVEYDGENDGIKISTGNKSPAKYTKAIATVSSDALLKLIDHHSAFSLVPLTDVVTVMVVNLYYKDPDILPEHGFGYLIPRSIPFIQNPECALGVVFDSDSIRGQDTASGTKVTVMLGGHWWDAFDIHPPDEEEAITMARSVLYRHLKIVHKPDATRVSLQRNCIPQYTVGHDSRMARMHSDLMHVFRGKLAVAGNSYTGVGVNDCVRAARDAVMGMQRGTVATGLEDAGRDDLFVQVKGPT